MIKTLTNTLSTIYPYEEARAIGFALLEDLFRLRRTDVLLGRADALSDAEKDLLQSCIERLLQGEPLQYVVGTALFGDLRLNVSPATLIPRPETLELVEWIVEEEHHSSPRLLDIGTGSGCIAIALALRLPHATVEGWDISEEALAVARHNATQHGADITFAQVDICSPLAASPRFTTIVSNPPYICESERSDMAPHVLNFEPATALFVPDTDPLLFYRAIAQKGKQLLLPRGALYFEINSAYGDATCHLLRQMGYTDVVLKKDSFGNDRMVRAYLPNA